MTRPDNFIDIAAWIAQRFIVVNPEGMTKPPVQIQVAQMLSRTSPHIEDDLDRSTQWYFYVGELLETLAAHRRGADREKSELFNLLADQFRDEMVGEAAKHPEKKIKVTEDAVKAKVRYHEDYIKSCATLNSLEYQEGVVSKLLNAVDRRIDTLRTISANVRQQQHHSDPRTAVAPAGRSS